MSEAAVKIIQITDCHLGDAVGEELLSMNPDESLDDVLMLINKHHQKADLLLVTGDLANEATLPAYQRLHNSLASKITYPFAWLPGNHDDPAVMETLGDTVNIKVHTLGAWVIILLNSRVEGRIYGNLSRAELQFLEETLTEHKNKHTMVCLHHQPVPIGSQWMDNYIVRNAQDFWSLIESHPQVNIVAWGHVHQEFSERHNNIALLSAPSTCIQFTPGKKDFDVEDTMPGYRWFELNTNGSFTTGVERVPQKDYGIDVSSGGY